MVGGTGPTDDVRRKLAVLRRHCEARNRPFQTVLRTHFTGWLVLAEDEARLRRKVRHYFPGGLEQRFAGPWRGFAVAATVEQATASYRALADAGIQYFVVQVLDAGDEETIRLLAERVIPGVQGRAPLGGTDG